ncbi:DUF4253 domain-containing protein [Tsukamurella sp. NPDC003166]|uniref:DUF4253 domain-containing protein n=1 Tax=Tsukamurella sp. NPDC003166 TaxID=3154444 RepID=UPI0033A09851
MFRATPGKLPAADTAEVGGVALPAGRLVTAEEGDGTVVAWISTEMLAADRLDGLVRELAAAFPRTGLWPLQAKGLEDDDLARPWGDGELEGPSGREVPDALAALTRAGVDGATDDPDDEEDEPSVPPVTTLAPAVPGADLGAGSLATGGDGGLLLVPVARPADVPAALGWMGAVNYDISGEDHAAVLRSWEDRFGAVLVGIGFDTLLVQVGHLPESAEQIDGLLREHYAYCPDNIDQGLSADDYRAGLTEWTHWSFWWD